MAADSGKPTDAGRPGAIDRLRELARAALPPMTPDQRQEGYEVVMARLAAHRGRRRAYAIGTVGLGAMAAAGALTLVLVARSAPPATRSLTYRAEAGEILAGGYLRSFGDQGMTLRFAEGSVFALSPGARGRLRAVDENGAHLALEQGAARVEVTHRPGARWLVDAGPFLITVKGTAFTVGWDAKSEQMDLRMAKGLVSVTGPILENVIAVRAGQRLAINLPKQEVVLHEMEAEPAPPPVAAAPAPALATAPSPVASAAPVVEPPGKHLPAKARGSFGWAAALAAGKVDAILDAVERLGLRRALAEAANDDLSALADAARYRGQEDVARQALLSQRSRFPNSSRADDAAFLLGRLEEAHAGGDRQAMAWYDLYLEGAPYGAYAAEALGRKMIATRKLLGAEAARAVAVQYLEHFPAGAYAGTARALRQTP
jgi:hypothetical protein